MNDFREHVRNQLRTVAGTYYGPLDRSWKAGQSLMLRIAPMTATSPGCRLLQCAPMTAKLDLARTNQSPVN